MNATSRRHPAWPLAGAAIALFVLPFHAALADVPSSTASFLSSHPMISGTVVMVNDHQMVVNTDQGEQIALEVDSRTMAPRDLAPGMVMRAEFRALEDCRFHAERIIPVRNGMSTNRLQSYANTHDSREAVARSVAVVGGRPYEDRVAAVSAESQERRESPTMKGTFGPITKATPVTRDYQFSTHPMISGRVATVNDHRLVVVTEQGQTVGMVMDSRTMLPNDVAPGLVVRADFTPMEDGRYYAQRIHLVDDDMADREQAYAHTQDGEFAVAQNSTDCDFVSATAPNRASSYVETPRTRPDVLPQTASNQPLILLGGLLALGSAGLVSMARRNRSL